MHLSSQVGTQDRVKITLDTGKFIPNTRKVTLRPFQDTCSLTSPTLTVRKVFVLLKCHRLKVFPLITTQMGSSIRGPTESGRETPNLAVSFMTCVRLSFLKDAHMCSHLQSAFLLMVLFGLYCCGEC